MLLTLRFQEAYPPAVNELKSDEHGLQSYKRSYRVNTDYKYLLKSVM